MRKIVLGAFVFTLSACVQHEDKAQDQTATFPKPEMELEVQYAKGFDIVYESDYTLLIARSIEGNEPFQDTLWLIHNSEFEAHSAAKVLSPAELHICLQSTTHLAFLDALGELEQVEGICGLQYVNDVELEKLISNNKNFKPVELCTNESIEEEVLFELNPDIFFIYPFESEETKDLEKKRVTTFMIAEYLETDPLARLEWIKLFGVIFGKELEANDYFENAASNYKSNIQQLPERPSFIMNVPFGDSWHMPSSNSLIVNLIEDAGFRYFFEEDQGTENILHSNEEVWEAGGLADYWIIIANRPADFTLEDLVAEENVYASFKAVKSYQVIFCSTQEGRYFLQGPVEPHILLNELIAIRSAYARHTAKYFHLLN